MQSLETDLESGMKSISDIEKETMRLRAHQIDATIVRIMKSRKVE